MTAYLYIYNNWRIYELPWNSAVTWVVAAILCDLGYYWVHRAAHGKLFIFSVSNLVFSPLALIGTFSFSLARHFFKNYYYFFTILAKLFYSLVVMNDSCNRNLRLL